MNNDTYTVTLTLAQIDMLVDMCTDVRRDIQRSINVAVSDGCSKSQIDLLYEPYNSVKAVRKALCAAV